MTLAVRIYSKREALSITEDIKSAGVSARRSLDRLADLIAEARNGNVWQILGHSSWTAYLSDTLGGAELRIPREERDRIFSMLAGEGLSTRAIAPIAGVSKDTVARTLARVANETPAPPEVEPEPENYWSPDEGMVGVDPITGVVHEAPGVTETTETFKVTTGLDGKQYAQKPRAVETPSSAVTDYLEADPELQDRKYVTAFLKELSIGWTGYDAERIANIADIEVIRQIEITAQAAQEFAARITKARGTLRLIPGGRA